MSETNTPSNFMDLHEIAPLIFRLSFHHGLDMTYSHVFQAFDLYRDLGKGSKFAVIAHLKGMRGIDFNTRRTLSEDRFASLLDAVAIIANDPMSRMLGNFIMGISQPKVPVRLFSSEEQAIQWIRACRNSEIEKPD